MVFALKGLRPGPCCAVNGGYAKGRILIHPFEFATIVKVKLLDLDFTSLLLFYLSKADGQNAVFETCFNFIFLYWNW